MGDEVLLNAMWVLYCVVLEAVYHIPNSFANSKLHRIFKDNSYESFGRVNNSDIIDTIISVLNYSSFGIRAETISEINVGNGPFSLAEFYDIIISEGMKSFYLNIESNEDMCELMDERIFPIKIHDTMEDKTYFIAAYVKDFKLRFKLIKKLDYNSFNWIWFHSFYDTDEFDEKYCFGTFKSSSSVEKILLTETISLIIKNHLEETIFDVKESFSTEEEIAYFLGEVLNLFRYIEEKNSLLNEFFFLSYFWHLPAPNAFFKPIAYKSDKEKNIFIVDFTYRTTRKLFKEFSMIFYISNGRLRVMCSDKRKAI